MFQFVESPKVAKGIVLGTIAITIIHTIYMNVMGFNSLSHDACAVYKNIPPWLFYLYENVLELFIVVVLGVFAGVLVEQYFNRIEPFFPKNQFLAFIYASILPVCSCSVLPLIDTMKKHAPLRVVITFVIAAPLLNPYIIFISFTVLGAKYAVIRIISSFILAIGTGLLVEFIAKRSKVFSLGSYMACGDSCGVVETNDLFVKTMALTRKLLPYIAFAALFSFVFQVFNPKQYLEGMSFNHEPWSMILMIIVGVPLYVCNGADVLFLRPLLAFTDLTMGSAMAFSLSASAICIASITMLIRFIGKPITIALVATLSILTLLIGTIINLVV